MIRDAATPGRRERLATDQTQDLLIVGGGIVGAGVARDAAMRGLKVALVEQSDFASGTSSRSSRLLHGGLRYLAQGHVGLVREASLEKCVIQQIAPHLAKPMPFIFPTYRGTPWKRWKLGIGVKVYDLLCNGRNYGNSRTLSERQVKKMLPGIAADGLTGAVRYFDGFTNDARLVIDTLRSASRHGASLFNYARFDEATPDPRGWACRVHDELCGQDLTIRARTVINAAGPWSDRFKQSGTPLRLTKGVHLILDRDRLPVDEAVVMAQGTRILFAIPWGKRVILGTTDTDFEGPPDAPTCDGQDVHYILSVANSVFPNVCLTEEDVNATWAGVRPLIANGQEAGTPSDISRSHSIRMTEPGWFDIAGGKLTTYRLMAQQVVDRVTRHIGQSKSACPTARSPLLDAMSLCGSGILPPEISRAQVEHYCLNEWAEHLDDVMIRRSSWAYYHKDTLSIALRVLDWMSDYRRWDRARADAELLRFKHALGPWRADMREESVAQSA